MASGSESAIFLPFVWIACPYLVDVGFLLSSLFLSSWLITFCCSLRMKVTWSCVCFLSFLSFILPTLAIVLSIDDDCLPFVQAETLCCLSKFRRSALTGCCVCMACTHSSSPDDQATQILVFWRSWPSSFCTSFFDFSITADIIDINVIISIISCIFPGPVLSYIEHILLPFIEFIFHHPPTPSRIDLLLLHFDSFPSSSISFFREGCRCPLLFALAIIWLTWLTILWCFDLICPDPLSFSLSLSSITLSSKAIFFDCIKPASAFVLSDSGIIFILFSSFSSRPLLTFALATFFGHFGQFLFFPFEFLCSLLAMFFLFSSFLPRQSWSCVCVFLLKSNTYFFHFLAFEFGCTIWDFIVDPTVSRVFDTGGWGRRVV